MSQQIPNLQDPIDAADWLAQAWQLTRPPADADQSFTLKLAAAIHTVVSTVHTLTKQLHDLKNQAPAPDPVPDPAQDIHEDSNA